jgi:hypothetical protein
MSTLNYGWFHGALDSTGRDHLGVQAQGIHIYGKLLPVITNITPRARYYTFYSWLVHELEASKLSYDEFKTVVRKADCLFGMVSIYHNATETGILGSDKLSKAVQEIREKSSCDINQYAKTYLKAPLGGLGYNYASPMGMLHLIRRTRDNRYVCRNRGKAFAELFASFVDGKLFWSVLNKGIITEVDLQALQSFQLNGISKNITERDALMNLLLETKRADQTSSTLQLWHQIAKEFTHLEINWQLPWFRAFLYAGGRIADTQWECPSHLKSVFEQWQDFARFDLFSIGLQGLFWAALKSQAEFAEHGIQVNTTRQFANACVDLALKDIAEFTSGVTLQDWLTKTGSKMQPIGNWTSEKFQRHESNFSLQIGDSRNHPWQLVLVNSLLLLLSIAVRQKDQISGVEARWIGDRMLGVYPVNLVQFVKSIFQPEQLQMPFILWIKNLLCEQVLENHTRISIQKLGATGKQTFCFYADGESLTVRQYPVPIFTNPHFGTTTRIFKDMGYLDDEGNPIVELEVEHA